MEMVLRVADWFAELSDGDDDTVCKGSVLFRESLPLGG